MGLQITPELALKFSDPKWFIERFFWIVDKQSKEVPFLLNPIQKKYYANRTRYDLILKARKEGLSSLILAIWLHACMFFRNTRAVVVSHEAESTKRLFGKARFYLSTMGLKDRKFKVNTGGDSQSQLTFPDTNSSFWVGTAGSRAFGRGDDITHLHLSEVAHYQDQTILTGVLEACVPNAWRVMETTANGTGDAFHGLWQRGRNGEIDFPWRNHFYSWFDDPTLSVDKVPEGFQLSKLEAEFKEKHKLSDNQVLWYRRKKAEMVDPNLMPQEYPSDDQEAFVATGVGAFDKGGLAAQDVMVRKPEWSGYLRDAVEGVEFIVDERGPLKIWKQPESGSRYIIAADVAKGVEGGDNSVGIVIDRGNWEVVAKFKQKIDVMDFGKKLYGLGLYYNTAKIAVEVWPGPGLATGKQLVALGYPKDALYRRIKWDGDKHVSDDEIGWVTDERGRYDLVTSLQNAVAHKRILVRDQESLDEMRSFVRNERGRYEARSGCHDDHVIALGIACFCMTTDPLEEVMPGRGSRNIGSAVRKEDNKPHGKLWRARMGGRT